MSDALADKYEENMRNATTAEDALMWAQKLRDRNAKILAGDTLGQDNRDRNTRKKGK